MAVRHDPPFYRRNTDLTGNICPLCSGAGVLSVHRSQIPVLQNVVYASAEAAQHAPHGRLDLATCRDCGFSWNAGFDATAIVYDERYDNHVASSAFTAYYRSLATMLIDRFDIRDGTVYDIGCGKGEFLREFSALAPAVRCIGIDPSCTPIIDGNFELRCMAFDRSVFDSAARLVLLRHVLEHIDTPAAFLEALRDAMPAAPLFVEVPDLDWILKADAFWDFCYEHCNYFTPKTLGYALARAGFDVSEQQNSFGDQYQWALAVPAAPLIAVTDGSAAIAATCAYAARETTALARLQSDARQRGGVAIWGMATKGVMLAILLGADHVITGIDMNIGKQGLFAAGSGVRIMGLSILESLPPQTRVIVMNPNYFDEISAMITGVRRDLVITSA